MACGPPLPKSPLELLETAGHVEKPLLSKIWGPAVCGVVGFSAVIVGNFASRRPIFSGIQKHILFAAGGVAVGKLLDDYRNQYLAERDAIYRHYITLHPDDFPDYDRKKIGDLFLPWIPVR